MKAQWMTDIGGLVAICVGLFVIHKALKTSIKSAVEPHITSIANSVDTLTTTVDTLQKHVGGLLSEDDHKTLCALNSQRLESMEKAHMTRLQSLEKALCGKIQLLTDLVSKLI